MLRKKGSSPAYRHRDPEGRGLPNACKGSRGDNQKCNARIEFDGAAHSGLGFRPIALVTQGHSLAVEVDCFLIIAGIGF